MIWGAYGAENPSDGGIRWHDVSEPANRAASENRRSRPRKSRRTKAPPAGFEPALPAPEAEAKEILDPYLYASWLFLGAE